MSDQSRSGESEPVVELVFQFLEACEEGEVPTVVLARLCAAHPGAAARFRAAVESLSGSGLAAEAPAAVRERQIGPYRLIERLGAGGMGVVYRAAPPEGEEVALKLLHPRERNEPASRARFGRETRAVRALDHPSIVRVIDHGAVEEDGLLTPYLAMELHRGATLDRFLACVNAGEIERGDGAGLGLLLHSVVAPGVDPLERSSVLRGPWWRIVSRLGASLASALAHAHGRGIVHRDVKPSNVLVTGDGRAMLLDFGLAAVRGSGRLTTSGAQLGSLPYMAPEQVEGDAADERVDVYGLGLVLHELLTLRPPLAPGTAREAAALAIVRGLRLERCDRQPWVPEQVGARLDAVIGRATERLARQRYASVRELADDLGAILEGRAPMARRPSAVERAGRVVRRHPWRAATALLLVLLGAGGPVVASGLTARHDRLLAAENERRETEIVEAVRREVEAASSGVIGLSRSSIGFDPRFAPSALPALEEARGGLFAARERLEQVTYRDTSEPRGELEYLLAETLIALANARVAVADFEGAEAAYHEHLDQLDVLEARYGPSDALLSERGRSLGQFARCRQESNILVAAEEEAGRAVEIFEGLAARGFRLDRTVEQLCGARLMFERALRRIGDTEAADDLLDRAEAELLAYTGPGPEPMGYRTRLAEIDWRRARWHLETAPASERLAALDRAAEWIDGASTPFTSNLTVALIRVQIERDAIVALERVGRLNEALERASALVELTNNLAAIRSDEELGADEPLGRAQKFARELLAIAQVNQADPTGGLAEMRRVMEVARKAHEGASLDPETLLEYARTAGNYANQLMLVPEVGAAHRATATAVASEAIDAARAAEDPHPALPEVVTLCHYARGLAAAKGGDAKQAAADAEALLAERGVPEAFALRMAADLWCELLLADPDGEGAGNARAEALDLLERAVAAGYRDSDELLATPALEPLREEPRFRALLRDLE